MITSIIMDGALFLVKLIRYSNNHKVARIYNPADSRIPVKVLDIDNQGRALDEETGKYHKFNVRDCAQA